MATTAELRTEEAPPAIQYEVGVTEKGQGLHFTTDGKTSLCNRSMVYLLEGGERQLQDGSKLCGLCRKGRAKGSISPTTPRARNGAGRRSRSQTNRPALLDDLETIFPLADELRASRETERQASAKLREIKTKLDDFFKGLGI